jgi:hypothetical protein
MLTSSHDLTGCMTTDIEPSTQGGGRRALVLELCLSYLCPREVDGQPLM